MSKPQDMNVDLYTRNGFAGPFTTVARPLYTPAFKRVEGDYVPRRFNAFDIPIDTEDPRALPVAVLTGAQMQIEVAKRSLDMPFALRNVFADELHFYFEGEARLESDFGMLDIRAGDFIHIPRATSYRIVDIAHPVTSINLVTPSQLRIEPDHAPGVLNPDLDVHAAQPSSGPPLSEAREFEVVLRHGAGTTSYFYDSDPLFGVAVAGDSLVRKFNIDDVHGLGVSGGGLVLPPLLINDETTHNLIYHLGSRMVGRPPIHHNADYDEVIVFAHGPGKYGATGEPGTVMWTPKGVIHQGPEENVPEGYQAWLLETRSNLSLSAVAAAHASVMETANYGAFSAG